MGQNNSGERALFGLTFVGKSAPLLFQLKKIMQELKFLAEDDFFGKQPCIQWMGFSALSVVPQTLYPHEAIKLLDDKIEEVKLDVLLETTPLPPQLH